MCSTASAAAPHHEWASDHYTFSGGAPVQHPNNATAIQMEIMQRGPVTAAFSVYSDFGTPHARSWLRLSQDT